MHLFIAVIVVAILVSIAVSIKTKKGPVHLAALEHFEARIHDAEKAFAGFVAKGEKRVEAEVTVLRNQLARSKATALVEHVEKVFKG